MAYAEYPVPYRGGAFLPHKPDPPR